MQNLWQTVKQVEVWEEFIKSHPSFSANFTQSFTWGQFYENYGRLVFRRGLFQNKKMIAGYTAVLEVGRFYRFLTITGGPLLDWTNVQIIKSFKADVKKIANQKGATFVRLRPAIVQTSLILKNLQKTGFKVAPMALTVELAGFLDLTLSDEQILQNMSQSLRRKIRKIQSNEKIKIKVSRSKKDAQIFANLHQKHAILQKYIPFPARRLMCQFQTFVKSNQALLYLAFLEKEILAANMIFFYNNEASYHFGISTPLGQKYSTAPLLHLKAIAEAKKRKLNIYNFWGITLKSQNKHRYFGVSQFKRSFGIIEHRYVKTHDLIIKWWLYPFIWLFEFLRRKYRRL